LSDDTTRLSMIGQIIRGRWRLLVAFTAMGALLGAGASLLYAPRYQATSSVLVQGPQEPDELVTETRIATSSVVLDRTAAAIGWGVDGTELRDAVHARVLDGNVIGIRAVAETPERAQQLADRTVEEYIAFSAQLASDVAQAPTQVQVSRERQVELRRQIDATNEYIAWLRDSPPRQGNVGNDQNDQVVTELEKLRVVLNKATMELESAQAASGRARVAVLARAERPSSPRPPNPVQLVVGGALLFFLLGVVGHLVATGVNRRLRAEADIAAALGSPILASVDVPDDDTAGRRRWAAGIRRLMWDNRPWDVRVSPISDDLSLDARYHRVLTRLRGRLSAMPEPMGALVLVPSDDAIAHRAAERLAVMAGAEGGPGLRVVDIHAGRPMVPDAGGLSDSVSAVLVVLAPGTRTAWELRGIAEASADAGHKVLGAVTAYRASRPRSARSTSSAAPEAGAGRDAMAGSA
jgi:capsular polysaccharide biosynthesis protein